MPPSTLTGLVGTPVAAVPQRGCLGDADDDGVAFGDHVAAPAGDARGGELLAGDAGGIPIEGGVARADLPIALVRCVIGIGDRAGAAEADRCRNLGPYIHLRGA